MWVSESVGVTDFIVVVRDGEPQDVFFVPYGKVGEHSVFADRERWVSGNAFVYDLRKNEPVTYAGIARFLAR